MKNLLVCFLLVLVSCGTNIPADLPPIPDRVQTFCSDYDQNWDIQVTIISTNHDGAIQTRCTVDNMGGDTEFVAALTASTDCALAYGGGIFTMDAKARTWTYLKTDPIDKGAFYQKDPTLGLTFNHCEVTNFCGVDPVTKTPAYCE